MSQTRTVLFVAGTRPELIKVLPVVRALRAAATGLTPRVCLTGQHQELLLPILRDFGFSPDLALAPRPTGGGLSDELARVVTGLSRVFEEERPALVAVQGDTTSTFAGALAAQYLQVPVAHIEAGLRTADRYAPFPEELNRRLTTHLATLHLAPTEWARKNLLAEGVAPEAVHVTGNTVIDVLLEVARSAPPALPVSVAPGRPLLLVTLHRREILGGPLEAIARAIGEVVAARPEVEVVWPVHLNPRVQEAVLPVLSGIGRVHLVEPCGYHAFVHLMKRATLILSDSGGVQEEAPALGVPVLVLRETTERPEAVEAGCNLLVGIDRRRIVTETLRLLDEPGARAAMARGGSPYGDGHASERIAALLAKALR